MERDKEKLNSNSDKREIRRSLNSDDSDLDRIISGLSHLDSSPEDSIVVKGFQDLRIQDYPSIEIPESLGLKISQLEKIWKSIERKPQYDFEDEIEKKYRWEKFKIDYPEELNRSQLHAVCVTDKPLLIIAGAGTGKTRTIVYRVSFLVENNVDPSNILLLTFTNKAANEMISRTRALLNEEKVENIVGGTFHSFANHILRKYSGMLNVNPKFTIIDTVDSADILALLKEELKITHKNKAFPKKNRLQEIISKSRNCNISIEDVIDREFTGLKDFVEKIELIARAYKKYKSVNNIFDFDDLIETLRDSLKNNQNFRKKLQDQFKYVLIDEYQDTNLIQKEITDFIAEKHRNITVVGDDSQSIYAFRGANFENILRFPATYHDAVIVKIEENFRSNQGILNFANGIVKAAKLGYSKNLYTKNKTTYKPLVKSLYSVEDEAEYVVTKILETREKISLNRIAVLYRASFHSNYIQAELLKRKIPYVVYGGIKFIERRHVRDIISYLRIVQNPYDAAAWHRILKLLPGIGNITAGKVVEVIRSNTGTINFNSFSEKKYYSELLKLQDVLIGIQDDECSVPEKIARLKEYYYPILKTLEFDYNIRILDVEVLNNLAAKYSELEKFLSDFAIDPPSNRFQDRTVPLIDESEEKPLVLSTLHSAKGLEWHTVFIVHLVDGLFPSARSFKNIEEFEEERRLFYVGCTRAEEELYLTVPAYYSDWNSVFTLPSRFIIEIESDKFDFEMK